MAKVTSLHIFTRSNSGRFAFKMAYSSTSGRPGHTSTEKGITVPLATLGARSLDVTMPWLRVQKKVVFEVQQLFPPARGSFNCVLQLAKAAATLDC
jgi:hypothetical protein